MYQDGQTATNPQTGEKVVLQGGQWVPMGSGTSAPRQQAPGIIYGRPKPVDPLAERRLDIAEETNARAATAAERAATASERQVGNEVFNQASRIRDDYNQDPTVKAFQRVLPKYVSALKQADGTAAGDLALTYAFATLMDPQSAVREGEQAMQAGGDTLYGRTVARLAKELGEGGTFRPEYRKSLLDQMRKAGAELRVTYDTQRKRYADMAQRAGLNPEDVVGHDPARDYGDQEAAIWASMGDEGARGLLAKTRFQDALTPPTKTGPRGERLAGEDEAVVFGDEQKPVTAKRYTPEQEAQIIQAIRDGDLGQTLALHKKFSGNDPTEDTIRSAGQAIAAAQKDPKTPIGIGYGNADAAAQSAADTERFGDNLAPAMEARKDLVVDPIVRGVADIVPFSDEIAATGNTIFGSGSYADNVRRERAIDEADSRINTAQRVGGQIAGAAIPVGRIFGFGRTAGGVARSAASYGREGAVLGGAYAAGKADPNPDASFSESVARRAAAAPIGAAIGGGAAYGLGALVNRMGRNKPGGPGGPTDGAKDIAAAAAEEGIDLLPADMGGPVTKGATAIARQGWLSEGPITARAMKSASQAGQARGRAAAVAGQPLENDEAGEIVRKGADIYSKQTGQTGNALYDRAYKMAGDTKAPLSKAIAAADAAIAELGETPGGSALLDEITALRTQMAKGNFTVRGIRNMRTRLREEADFKGLRGGDTSRRLGQIIDAASEDVADALQAAGKIRAAKAFRTADDFWRQRVETIDQVLDPLLGKNAPRSGEKILGALEGMAKRETGNSASLRRVMKALPENEANSVRATVINRLGADGDGADFSFAKFLTRWDGMSAKAKTTLFPPESIKALNNIATVAKGAKATAAYSNTSNSGRAIAGQILFSSIASGAGGLATGGATAAGQIVGGRLLASPLFAKFLVKLPKMTDPKVISNSLSTIARRDPAIAQDALGLQQYLQQAMGNVPLRAAAGDDKAQGREVPVQR